MTGSEPWDEEVGQTPLSIDPPAPFHFKYTAHSHGWVMLAPNRWDEGREALHRVERLVGGRVVDLEITGPGTPQEPTVQVLVRHQGALSPTECAEITTKVAHMLRVDEDLTEFYALCRERGEPWVYLTSGVGRLLRSPTLFEDVVKTICTTNVQWGGTLRMVEGLVHALGEPYPGEPTRRAFPTPQAMAEAPPGTFTETARLGYRGRYVHALAQHVASGELDLEALQADDLATAELKKRLLAIKGVGPYAAATLLMLLGRYDEIAVDTVFRKFVSEQYFDGAQPSDEEAKAVYEGWGRWRYLAYWFDIWRDIHEEG
jgi:3-methyladenine DNA glycosylase/8-oxoguanine DNA glycosylase